MNVHSAVSNSRQTGTRYYPDLKLSGKINLCFDKDINFQTFNKNTYLVPLKISNHLCELYFKIWFFSAREFLADLVGDVLVLGTFSCSDIQF